MPQHKAPPQIWEELSSQLPVNKSERLQTLPQHQAPDHVWEHLSKELSQALPAAQIRRRKVQRRLVYGLSVAASIALLFWVSVDRNAGQEGSITYTEEVVANNDFYQEVDFSMVANDDEVLRFVDEHCIATLPACDTELFSDLFESYKSLLVTSEEIRQRSASTGTELELVHSWTFIEKQKAEIGKQIIDLILS